MWLISIIYDAGKISFEDIARIRGFMSEFIEGGIQIEFPEEE